MASAIFVEFQLFYFLIRTIPESFSTLLMEILKKNETLYCT
jgi:hypothetical protein